MSRFEEPIGGASASGGATASAQSHAGRRAGWRGTWPGLALAFFGGLALYADRHVTAGKDMWVGPAVMPDILSVALLALGMLVAAEGFTRRADDTDVSGARAGGPALALIAAAAIFLLSLGILGLPSAAGLSATIIAGYALRTRPVAFVWTVAAGFTIALLLYASSAIFKGAELWTF